MVINTIKFLNTVRNCFFKSLLFVLILSSIIFPGMKFRGVGGEKQMHTYSPEEIARVCTNYLLISGSAVSRSPNPGETAYGILKVIAANSKSTL